MAFTGLAIAAALALAKDQLVDKPADKRKRELAAKTQQYSPWTGNKADTLNDSNTLGSMMQYGTTGAMIGQGVSNSNAQNSYLDSKAASDGVADPNLSQGNTFMAGPNPYSGKEAVMNPNAGLSQPSMGASPTGRDPSWYFGNQGGVNTDLGMANKDPYKGLYAQGTDPNSLQSYWKTGNPYTGY